MAELIYWDSATFLAFFHAEADRVDLCQHTLERARNGDAVIITSALAVTECLWLRGEKPIPKNKADILRRFFRRSYIRVRGVTRAIAESAQELVWDHGIKPKDAVHVATAINAKVDALETFDEGLIGKSMKAGTPPLLIRKPQSADQGRLDV
jgi:predicted nucleic acid-binding protein